MLRNRVFSSLIQSWRLSHSNNTSHHHYNTLHISSLSLSFSPFTSLSISISVSFIFQRIQTNSSLKSNTIIPSSFTSSNFKGQTIGSFLSLFLSQWKQRRRTRIGNTISSLTFPKHFAFSNSASSFSSFPGLSSASLSLSPSPPNTSVHSPLVLFSSSPSPTSSSLHFSLNPAASPPNTPPIKPPPETSTAKS